MFDLKVALLLSFPSILLQPHHYKYQHNSQQKSQNSKTAIVQKHHQQHHQQHFGHGQPASQPRELSYKAMEARTRKPLASHCISSGSTTTILDIETAPSSSYNHAPYRLFYMVDNIRILVRHATNGTMAGQYGPPLLPVRQLFLLFVFRHSSHFFVSNSSFCFQYQ